MCKSLPGPLVANDADRRRQQAVSRRQAHVTYAPFLAEGATHRADTTGREADPKPGTLDHEGSGQGATGRAGGDDAHPSCAGSSPLSPRVAS